MKKAKKYASVPVIKLSADKIKIGDCFKNEEGWCFLCTRRNKTHMQGNRVFDDQAHTYRIGSKNYKKLIKINKKEFVEFEEGIIDASMCV